MRKISSNIKIELTEEEVKLINDIWHFCINLDEEFGTEISETEFVDFIVNVANNDKYTWLNNEYIEIVRK